MIDSVGLAVIVLPILPIMQRKKKNKNKTAEDEKNEDKGEDDKMQNISADDENE